MALYCGIDLHSTNSFVVVLDERDQICLSRRFGNDLDAISAALAPFRSELVGVAVESTFNWYWLVDGLMELGYTVSLVHTAAVVQYEGLKHADDRHDARWLAHLLRLGLLPRGYIYPREERAVRDLLRKRSHLVRQRSANIASLKNLQVRNTGRSFSATHTTVRHGKVDIEKLIEGNRALAMEATCTVIAALDQEVERLEAILLRQGRLKESFRQVTTIPGIGNILGLTIAYETGDLGRFPRVGDYSSYCRCVESRRLSNGKTKGRGNAKSGNRYLAWAFSEAAHFCRRFDPLAKRFYDRKSSQTHPMVAQRALANKLARASYYVMRDHVPFRSELLFR